MICSLCEKEHYDPYKIKVQRVEGKNKVNLAEGRVCRECAMQNIYKIEQAKEEQK